MEKYCIMKEHQNSISYLLPLSFHCVNMLFCIETYALGVGVCSKRGTMQQGLESKHDRVW